MCGPGSRPLQRPRGGPSNPLTGDPVTVATSADTLPLPERREQDVGVALRDEPENVAEPAGGFGAVISPWMGSKTRAVTVAIGACVDCEPSKPGSA